MSITVLLIVLLGIAGGVCVARGALARLGLDVRETLLWLGLAELPAQPVRRRGARAPRDSGLLGAAPAE